MIKKSLLITFEHEETIFEIHEEISQEQHIKDKVLEILTRIPFLCKTNVNGEKMTDWTRLKNIHVKYI